MGFQAPGRQPFDLCGLSRPQGLTAAPILRWASFPLILAMEQGVGAALSPSPRLYEEQATWAAGAPGKHWKELGSLDPTEEAPFGHWAETEAITPISVGSTLGCMEKTHLSRQARSHPGGAPGATRASERRPAPLDHMRPQNSTPSDSSR